MKTSEQQQFLEILKKYKKLLFKIANAYCYNTDERQDLIQEIILQLWKAYPKYNPTFALSTWIYRIALNVSISYYRTKKKQSKIYHNYQQIVQLEQNKPPSENEQLDQLYQFIEQLPPIEKAFIILYLDGYHHKEIATIMGISASNVSTKLNRIKNKLKTNINQQ